MGEKKAISLSSNIILMIIRLLCVMLMTYGLFSCQQGVVEEPNIDFGYEYFPLSIGQNKTFRLDSIIFDPIVAGISIDTFSWLLKEEIVDTLRDGTGALIYVVERSQRRIEDDDWVVDRVWTMSRTNRQAIRTEDNLRFIKMNFPIRENADWDANIFVDKSLEVSVAGETLEIFKGWESKVLTIEKPFDLNGQVFDKVLTIQLADNENLIEYRYGVEHYAKDIGLIYKELWVVDTQCEFCCNSDYAFCESLEWITKAEAGFVLRQQLID